MDERFLEQARREPRPEFARGLRERLRGIEQEDAAPGFRLNPALAGVFAAVAVALLFTLPSVRVSAQAMLDLFRVRNFTAVQFDPARIEKLKSMKSQNQMLPFDNVETITDPGPLRAFPTPEAAGLAANLAVRQIRFLPSGLAPDSVLMRGEGQARFTLHEATLRAALETLDLRDVDVPAGLDGKTINVHTLPVVVQTYRNGGARAALMQARSPEVALPPGIDLERLGVIGLRMLGLDAAEARRVASGIDWHTTLVIPVPLDASTFRRITVHGQPGLLVTRSGKSGDGERRREGTCVLWTENDIVYGLETTSGPPDAMQMAESVQ